MNTTAEDTRPLTFQITLSQADHLSPAERQELVEAFRGNLEIILGGRVAMQRILQEQYAQHYGPGRDSATDVEPQGALRRAFIVADYTTWMGRDRPMGAHFGLLFDRAASH